MTFLWINEALNELSDQVIRTNQETLIGEFNLIDLEFGITRHEEVSQPTSL
jgi:hypothetical protein